MIISWMSSEVEGSADRRSGDKESRFGTQNWYDRSEFLSEFSNPKNVSNFDLDHRGSAAGSTK